MLFVTSVFAQTYPQAVGLGAIDTGLNIQSVSYTFTVPPLPANNTGAAYEYHFAIVTGNNNSLIKSSFAYGCEIQAHIACYPPFENRYIFYVTVLNQVLNYRTQYPSNGVALSPGNYSVSYYFTKCDIKVKALEFSVSNSTWSYSQKICSMTLGGTYSQAITGLIEIHDATSCSQFPLTQSATEGNILLNNQSATSWRQMNLTPPIDCDFALSINGNSVSYLWNDNASG